VRIASVRVLPYRLPLRVPLVTAGGTLRERCGWILCLETACGMTGLGEAAPLPGFGGEAPGATRAALDTAARALPGARLDAVEEACGEPQGWLAGAPAAAAALDTACHDLRAHGRGVPLATTLAGARGGAAGAVPVNALLSESDPEALCAVARDAAARGFGTLKLKVGAGDAGDDVRRAAAVRRGAGPAVHLRLDANGAWPPDEALRRLERLAAFDPEWVEQPVAAHDVAGLARVRAARIVPVAADESLRTADDARRLLDAGAADAWILKPAWLGGPSVALPLARAARRAGVAVAVTSALDAAVGRTAALHLAAALGGDVAAGLATGDRLARDVARAPAPRRGRIAVPRAPGLGIQLAAPVAAP